MTLPVCKHDGHYMTHKVPPAEDQCPGSIYVLISVNDSDIEKYESLEELIEIKVKNAELILRGLLKDVR